MELEAFARTESGPVRENNEDALLIDVEQGVFSVADGMGGHAAGEVAATLAVEAIREILVGSSDPEETRLVREDEPTEVGDILRERLRYAMNQASVQIRRQSEIAPHMRGMGTTLVVLVIEGGQAHLAHVGDSRAYLFREGTLVRLTRDHTVVQQEIDAGRLTPELARLVPHKHILTQSVGFHGSVEPDSVTRVVEEKDIFVLCSDGLTDVVSDEEICRICEHTQPEELADTLVEKALAADTQDNITVVVVSVV